MMHKSLKIIIIIQARTDSRRLPEKILKKIEKKPLLWHVIQRVSNTKIKNVIVSTTKRKIDDRITEIAKNCGAQVYRGKTNDVLDRFYKTALFYNADIIIRITADCPVIDPEIILKVLKRFLRGKYDYVTSDDNTFPNGVDAECFSFKTLEKTWKNAKLPSEREHVTSYIWNNPKIFKLGKLKNIKKLNRFRWVVDHKDDLILIQKIYAELYNKNKIFLMNDIINLFERKPELLKINENHEHDEGYSLSLENDKLQLEE